MNMIKIHGRGIDLDQIGKQEGWAIEQIPYAQFAKMIVFESEDSQILFHLKYGYGK